jgi:hypothetical protein
MNREYTTTEDITPCGEVKINIFFKRCDEEICLNFFIANYKISKFFKGKFFIKRLINKIFKYKLNKKILWDKNFWNKISIHMFESKIRLKINIDDFNNKINKHTKSDRLKDVMNYKELLMKGCNLGEPLYISSKCLNYLGADIKEDKVFILDGSRRLVAYTMLNMNPKILLIDINK